MRTEKEIRASLDERVRYLLEEVYRVDEPTELKKCSRCGKRVRIFKRFTACRPCRNFEITGSGKILKRSYDDE